MPTGARTARTSDAPHIAAIQIRAWRTAFPELPTVQALDADDVTEAWRLAIADPPDPRWQVLVAVDADSGADQVVGYAAIAPDEQTGAGQLLDLVIDPAAQRTGHGSRLMSACVDHLRAAGHREVVGWIPATDGPRRAFMESAGWGPDGAFRDLSDGTTTVREVRMVTVIADDA